MVKARVNNKAKWKHFCSSEEKWPTKAVLDRNKIKMEELLRGFLMKQFLMKQLFYSGLLDIKYCNQRGACRRVGYLSLHTHHTFWLICDLLLNRRTPGNMESFCEMKFRKFQPKYSY